MSHPVLKLIFGSADERQSDGTGYWTRRPRSVEAHTQDDPPSPPDDDYLLASMATGDESAFRQLFERHYAALCDFAAAILRDDTMASSDIAKTPLTKSNRRMRRISKVIADIIL